LRGDSGGGAAAEVRYYGMASRREEGRAKEKSRRADMKKKREAIADLQRKLKEMIDKRNGRKAA
jgi:hypothetical protein